MAMTQQRAQELLRGISKKRRFLLQEKSKMSISESVTLTKSEIEQLYKSLDECEEAAKLAIKKLILSRSIPFKK